MKEKFVAVEQDNQWLLGDLQQISLEKRQMQQQHEELALRVQQLEAIIVSLAMGAVWFRFSWVSRKINQTKSKINHLLIAKIEPNCL